jgi:AcrR family transcriptional regulator
MPRKPEPKLQSRILEAALQLFVKGGEKGLSMRTLAKLARTNTPAVYRRFRNRGEILHAIADHYRLDVYAVLEPCGSLEEMCHALLDLALRQPREYELFYSELISKVPGPRSNFEFAKAQAAAWLGSAPQDHDELVLALTVLVHGTAMLLISGAVTPEGEPTLRAVFSASIQLILGNRATLRAARPMGNQAQTLAGPPSLPSA